MIKRSSSNYAFCLQNPLVGTNPANFGIIDFWIWWNLDDFELYKDHIILDYMFNSSYPAVKLIMY